MIQKRLKTNKSLWPSKRPGINRLPPRFLLVCLLLFVAVFLGVVTRDWWLGLRPAPDFYYPQSSFKVPEDVLRERIATKSAQSLRIPIILYHYIEAVDKTKDPGRYNLATSPYYLDKQISSLKNGGYTFLFARDVPTILGDNSKMPRQPVVLTFDDGYEDFYWQALPILKKYQARGTIYVITDFVGRTGYLTWPELRQIRDSGLVEIGAHTLNHAYLKNIKPELAKAEIDDSKARLENELGIKIVSFAYPFGAFDSNALQIVKSAGYTNAVSVIPGVNQSENNLFYLFRLRSGFLPLPDPAKTLAAYK